MPIDTAKLKSSSNPQSFKDLIKVLQDAGVQVQEVSKMPRPANADVERLRPDIYKQKYIEQKLPILPSRSSTVPYYPTNYPNYNLLLKQGNPFALIDTDPTPQNMEIASSIIASNPHYKAALGYYGDEVKAISESNFPPEERWFLTEMANKQAIANKFRVALGIAPLNPSVEISQEYASPAERDPAFESIQDKMVAEGADADDLDKAFEDWVKSRSQARIEQNEAGVSKVQF